MNPVFTDAGAAIEEMEYLAHQDDTTYAIVTVYQVMTYAEAREADLQILEVHTR